MKSVEFDSSGILVWVGDEKVYELLCHYLDAILLVFFFWMTGWPRFHAPASMKALKA